MFYLTDNTERAVKLVIVIEILYNAGSYDEICVTTGGPI
jgi:hypothetical protein